MARPPLLAAPGRRLWAHARALRTQSQTAARAGTGVVAALLLLLLLTASRGGRERTAAGGCRLSKHDRIPHILHHVFLDGEAAYLKETRQKHPAFRREWLQTCRMHHLQWVHKFWDLDAAEQFLQRRYPKAVRHFRRLPNVVTKGDLLRYFLLHAYGGLYLDLDVECFRNGEDMLRGYHAVLQGTVREEGVTNAVMASAPGHPLMQKIIDAVLENIENDPHAHPIDSTGPGVVTKVLREDYADGAEDVSRAAEYEAERSTLVAVYNMSSWFTPCHWFDEGCAVRMAVQRSTGTTPLNLVGNHRYSGSWNGYTGRSVQPHLDVKNLRAKEAEFFPLNLTSEEAQMDRLPALMTPMYGSSILKLDGFPPRIVTWPRNDNFLRRTLKQGEVHNQAAFEASLKYLKKGSVVIDAGAGFGSYSMMYAHIVGPEGLVVAFEPQYLLFQVACSNFVLNDVTNVRIEHAALGFKNVRAAMSPELPDASDMAALGLRYDEAVRAGFMVNYGGWSLGVGGEGVRMLALDSFKLKGVAFMKVCTEGAEPLVFWGARNTIRNNLPVILFQHNWKQIEQELVDALRIPKAARNFNVQDWAMEELGYTFGGEQGGNMFLLLPPSRQRIAELRGQRLRAAKPLQ